LHIPVHRLIDEEEHPKAEEVILNENTMEIEN